MRRGKRHRCGGINVTRILFVSLSLLSLFLILRSSELAIDYMERGMRICVVSVIPSLFPFMVISELIVLSGAAEYVGAVLKKPFRILFGIGGEGTSAFLLGMVCGFPVGARAALTLYKRKRISLGELSRLICFSNVPSSAFVISAVGAVLFGCRSFGVALYFITILSAVIIGVLLNLIYGDVQKKEDASSETKAQVEHAVSGGISSFSGAVLSAANGMLGICAFVIFFSVLTGLIGNALDGLGASQPLKAWIVSLFELTGGVAASAGVKPVFLAALIAAFSLGWSGLSVHFQLASFCDGVSVRPGRYIFSKLLHGVFNVFFCFVYMRLFGDRFSFDVKSVATIESVAGDSGELGIFISALFFSLVCIAFFSWAKRTVKQ